MTAIWIVLALVFVAVIAIWTIGLRDIQTIRRNDPRIPRSVGAETEPVHGVHGGHR